jgi:serine/threonine protein kinase
MSPEQLNGDHYDKSVDWWAVGIIIFELLFGKNPFNLEDEDMNFDEYKECIEENEIPFQSEFEYSCDIKDLISLLLNKDKSKRLKNIDQIKSHVWFKNTNWKGIHDRKVPTKIKPKIK